MLEQSLAVEFQTKGLQHVHLEGLPNASISIVFDIFEQLIQHLRLKLLKDVPEGQAQGLESPPQVAAQHWKEDLLKIIPSLHTQLLPKGLEVLYIVQLAIEQLNKGAFV